MATPNLKSTFEALIALHGYAAVMQGLREASVGCAVRLKNQSVADGFADFLRSTANDIQMDTRKALR